MQGKETRRLPSASGFSPAHLVAPVVAFLDGVGSPGPTATDQIKPASGGAGWLVREIRVSEVYPQEKYGLRENKIR